MHLTSLWLGGADACHSVITATDTVMLQALMATVEGTLVSILIFDN